MPKSYVLVQRVIVYCMSILEFNPLNGTESMFCRTSYLFPSPEETNRSAELSTPLILHCVLPSPIYSTHSPIFWFLTDLRAKIWCAHAQTSFQWYQQSNVCMCVAVSVASKRFGTCSRCHAYLHLKPGNFWRHTQAHWKSPSDQSFKADNSVSEEQPSP